MEIIVQQQSDLYKTDDTRTNQLQWAFYQHTVNISFIIWPLADKLFTSKFRLHEDPLDKWLIDDADMIQILE